MKTIAITALSLLLIVANTFSADAKKPMNTTGQKSTNATELATIGGGCFWCTEAVFQRIDGVKSVVSGYSGGPKPNPTYKEICTGETGHAEVIQVAFDPKKVSFSEILEVFWLAHDPTTLNRQGNDVGTQYRSVIFFHDEDQKKAAEASKKAAQPEFKNPIVTEISPFTAFYKAEDYHQNYFNNNTSKPYCQIVIRPKLDKVVEKLSKKKK